MTDVVAGRFALCDPIARGGSGTVWRAYDRKQQRFCAAKVLRRRDAGDLLRFVREQSVRLEHPNVLTPYSWAAEDAHVVIASELVDGGSLSTLIGDYGAMDVSTVSAVLDQLLHALEQVHAAGLVHRDVKPANLLLRATGTGPLQVMLSDFGLAVGTDDARLTEAGFVMGTPGYVAPELLRGGVAPDPRHDLYAAGRVAAALLAGAEAGPAPALADLEPPGACGALIADLCADDPARRPASAAAARVALGPVRQDEPPRTRDGEPIEVLHQLPPLSPEARSEAGADETQRLPAGHGPGSDRRRPRRARRPRRSVLVGAAAVAVAAAVGTPLGLSLSGDGDPSPSPGRSGSAPRTTTGSSGGSAGTAQVRVGSACGYLDENDLADVSGGGQARCTKHVDGDAVTYTWDRV